MGRPPLPPGTWGEIKVTKERPEQWKASAKYKDHDGASRKVRRWGQTKQQAKNRLLAALRDRARRSTDGDIKPETKVKDAAALWLRWVDDSGRAARTKQEYHDTWNRYLATRIGVWRVCDIRVSTTNRVITEVRDHNGRGAATHVKVVLSGIFGMCVRHDAIDDNPVREIESLGTRKRKKQRTINAGNVGNVLGIFHGSQDAASWDLVDMIDVLSGLGCRLGELLALRCTRSANYTVGTLTIDATVIRITGKGLYIQEYTKSDAGMRTIRPPAWVMDILKQREAEATTPYLFPSLTGTLRDPDNTRKYLRRVVANTEFQGLHAHDFRHYVATILDGVLTAREIADYLGHERISTTQEDYMERGVVGEKVGPSLGDKPIPVLPKGGSLGPPGPDGNHAASR